MTRISDSEAMDLYRDRAIDCIVESIMYGTGVTTRDFVTDRQITWDRSDFVGCIEPWEVAKLIDAGMNPDQLVELAADLHTRVEKEIRKWVERNEHGLIEDWVHSIVEDEQCKYAERA